MNTDEIRAEFAVVNALRQLRAPTGSPVDVCRVEQLWSEYGIRAADLQGAISRMCHTDRLKLFRDGDRDLVALTVAGESWSQVQPAWLEYRLLVPRRIRVAEKFCPPQWRAAQSLSRRSDRGPSTMSSPSRAVH